MTPNILSGETRERPYAKRRAAADLFMPEAVIMQIAAHADLGLEEDREVMGLLIGRIYEDDKGEYAVVEDAVTSKLESDRAMVRFDRDDMSALVDAIDGMPPGTDIVGWYHSHPGYGCFMSETDVRTQDGLFGGACGFALVVDPKRKEMAVFDSNPGSPGIAIMVILEDD
ncbi:MAG: Mov34/MPN/PAD-1 family protein [Candidatus Methanomethylophilaceae archaeon]|nr:Mov34/MPN/PAD-1 family protein [Candidatus Methanomethylophilaceae archaeon]